jgi:hypothetical protein
MDLKDDKAEKVVVRWTLMISSTYLIIQLQNQSYDVVTYVNSIPAPQSPFPVRWYSYPTTIKDFLRELHHLRLNRESPQRIISPVQLNG